MKLNEIEEMWGKDCIIDDIFLDRESTKDSHLLHHKYFVIFNNEKKALLQIEAELKLLKIDKWEYFNGILEEEKLKERGWLPCGTKILKSNVSLYIDSDKDILNMVYKIGIQQQKVDFLKAIIEQINRRNFHIKNAIDYKKFSSGLV